MKLFLVRHCSAEGQDADAPLTQAGQEQALRLADFLQEKEIARIISSPFLRARQSIQPLADRLGHSIDIDERLAERVLCGENHPDWRSMLQRTFDDLDLLFTGGESSRTAMQRALAVIEEVAAGGSGNTVLATHGNLLSLLLKHYDETTGYAEWERLTNPDVYLLSLSEESVIPVRIWKS